MSAVPVSGEAGAVQSGRSTVAVIVGGGGSGFGGWPVCRSDTGEGGSSGRGSSVTALFHNGGVVSDIGALSPLVAADAAGAPLSELARESMRHKPVMEVTVPGWLAERVGCVGRWWGVSEAIAAAWMLAEGFSRLLAIEESDPLDWRSEGIPRMDYRGPDGVEDSRELRVQVPGADLRVALGLLATRFSAKAPDVVVLGLVWGVTRLHGLNDRHDCAAMDGGSTTVGAELSAGRRVGLNAQEAAVLAEVPLAAAALPMLAPKQIIALALPAHVDDWLLCIADPWQTRASVVATWLLAEGAMSLFGHEIRSETWWRIGPNRIVVHSEPVARSQRQIEIPGTLLQVTIGWLASRCGADLDGMVILAVAVGAVMWQDDHGCGCGPRHSAGAGWRAASQDPTAPQ